MSSKQKISLEVISPEKILFQGEVDMVELPGAKGRFQVLPDHASLVSSLTSGDVMMESNKKKNSIEIQSGFVEVKNNKVVVLAGASS